MTAASPASNHSQAADRCLDNVVRRHQRPIAVKEQIVAITTASPASNHSHTTDHIPVVCLSLVRQARLTVFHAYWLLRKLQRQVLSNDRVPRYPAGQCLQTISSLSITDIFFYIFREKV